jgi:Spy/CpxP family protein refolding chaperone
MLTCALALVMLAGAAQAQQGSDRKEDQRSERRAAKKEMNLTPEQKEKLKSLREAQRKEMEALRANTSLSKEQQQAQRKAIHDKYRQEMGAILTPEQKSTIKENVKEGRGKRAHLRKGEGFDAARISKELELSPDQQSKLLAIHADYKNRRQAIASNSSLSREQKKEQLRTLTKSHMDQARTVLTPAQQQKAEGMLKDRRARNSR